MPPISDLFNNEKRIQHCERMRILLLRLYERSFSRLRELPRLSLQKFFVISLFLRASSLGKQRGFSFHGHSRRKYKIVLQRGGGLILIPIPIDGLVSHWHRRQRGSWLKLSEFPIDKRFVLIC